VPGDSTDDEDDSLLDRWGDIEHPFGDPEESGLVSEATQTSDHEPNEPTTEELSRDLSDVDPDLLNTFAVCAVLANLGVLLVSVGILLVVFRDQLQIGGGLVVIGSLTLVRVRQYYRSYKRDRKADAETAADGDSPSESETAADGDSPSESETAADGDPPSESEPSERSTEESTESGHNR